MDNMGDLCTHSVTTTVMGIDVRTRWWGGFCEDKLSLLNQQARECIVDALSVDMNQKCGVLTYCDDRSSHDLVGEWEAV